MKRLFVCRFPSNYGDLDLYDLFSKYGDIGSAKVIMGRDGHSRGFGFVEMESGGDEAINALHNSEVEGRPLHVGMAKTREQDAAQRMRSGGGGRSYASTDGFGYARNGSPPRHHRW